LVGFGPTNRTTGATVAGSRQAYLNQAGQLVFAVRPTGSSAPVTVSGSKSYADGKWHQLVAVQSASAVQLYVDGARVASVTSTAKMPALNGTWMLGGATPTGLPSRSTGTFNGALDDVSVFGSALSAKQVRSHYLTGQPKANVVVVRPPSRR
jgi:hypothetical protein